MDEPVKLFGTEEEATSLSELIDQTVAEMKAARGTIQADREEIKRLRAETRALGEETRAILSTIRKAA